MHAVARAETGASSPQARRAHLGTAVLIALVGLAGCASQPPAPEAVPAALDPGTAERMTTTVAARGVQVYECRSATGAAAPAWTFVAPVAELFDAQGRSIGSHGAGPYWQGHDGSRVEGSVRARADAPRTDAIPWLLLRTRSTGAVGLFGGVTHIQRLHTEGGVAPTAGCDAAHLGQRLRVPYRADYRLFTA